MAITTVHPTNSFQTIAALVNELQQVFGGICILCRQARWGKGVGKWFCGHDRIGTKTETVKPNVTSTKISGVICNYAHTSFGCFHPNSSILIDYISDERVRFDNLHSLLVPTSLRNSSIFTRMAML